MKLSLLWVLIVIDSICMGQTYVAEAELPPVDKEGFYNIILTPDKSQYLNSSFTNIRILDEDNKEVPYLLRADVPHMLTEVFREYSKIEKKQTKNCCTTIVLHNPDQRLSNNVRLVVKNADVTKEATLLGSDDKINWFALNQHLVLTPASSKEGTSEIKIVNFPLSDYQYYSLQIDDSTSAPLNILTAGYFEVETANGKYAEVPVTEITKTDSVNEKKSYLRIRFNGPMTLDKFELAMKGAPFFLRKGMVFLLKTRKLKGDKTEAYYEAISEIEITSKRPTNVELQALKVKDLLIVIDNEDNPALDIDEFKAFQLNRYLTAWFSAGTKYRVKVGKPDLAAPVYDISYFKDSIPPNLAILQMSAISFQSPAQVLKNDTFFTNTDYIWAVIIIVIAVLGVMSAKLLNDAGSKRNTPKSP